MVIARLLRRPTTRRWTGAGLALAAAATCSLSATDADAAAGHDPIGHLDSLTVTAPATIHVTGWAADPDQLSTPLVITATVDGQPAGSVRSAVARPDVARARGTGPTQGFALTVPTVAGGHQVCLSMTNVGAGATAVLECRTVVIAMAPLPAGTTPTPAQLAARSPFGSLEGATVAGTTVTLNGWAADPENLAVPLRIATTVDGVVTPVTRAVAVARRDVVAVKHTGPNQGYQVSATVPNGSHAVCTIAGNIGVGGPRLLGCRRVWVGPVPVTAGQIAAHSPSGAVESAVAASASSIRVTGWASDPDNRGTSLTVVAYLDGSSAATVVASVARPDLVRSRQTGARPGFDLTIDAAAGSHLLCLWVVNIYYGNNTPLGCSALSTPAVAMPTGPAPATAAGKAVVALAAKYLGTRYVWGGASPATGFDCSGLVQYSYRTAAKLTTPRVAQAQFRAARMITAGHAVPGDLVFYHDSVGAVYHVGIYTGPGTTYAAVDEQEGIRVQPIWDSTATYGSFTHS